MAATSANGPSFTPHTRSGIRDGKQLRLDEEKESLTLLSILRAFDGPINEERAWAVLYQAAKTALHCYLSSSIAAQQSSGNYLNPAVNSSLASDPWTKKFSNLLKACTTDDTGQQPSYPTKQLFKCCIVSEASHLWIHQEGHVHPLSFIVPRHLVEGRTSASSENQLVGGLGWTLFEALDYGLKREEQIVLSPDLEQMIDLMTSADDEVTSDGESQSADDEGIVGDSNDTISDSYARPHLADVTSRLMQQAEFSSPTVLSLTKILERCRMQVSSTASDAQADNHFRAVCRALVAETLEFSDFLVKVSAAPEGWRELRSKAEPENARDLAALHMGDWSRLWVQVIHQLRNGVKLKSVDVSARKPVEYELTPYEMLMNDIRSRRYKLRQVEGKIPPRVKKDAHAVILEFIRSRPPLRKASERRLRPMHKSSTPAELLMESIRKHDSRQLRPTQSLMRIRTDFSASSWVPIASKRKLLKADQFNPNAEDEDDDVLAEVPPASPPVRHLEGLSISVDQHSTAILSSNDAFSTPTRSRAPSSRRHSLVVIPTQLSRTKSAPSVKVTNLKTSSLAVPDPRIALHPGQLSGSSTSTSLRSSLSSAALPSPPVSPMHGGTTSHHLQDDFIRSEEFQQVVHGKLVTLEELVHMRRVLTAASLEALPSKSSVKEDVVNGKLCFACRKTRFSVFGAWRHGCKLCTRTVCTKCCSKMWIPSDRFDTVTVSEISWPDKLRPYSSSSMCSSPSATSSLFSGFHLRLPQLRLHSPGTKGYSSIAPPSSIGSTSDSRSIPTSPLLARRGSERCKLPSSQADTPFIHQALSKNQSLSTNNTHWAQKPEKKRDIGVEGYVCRECQSLIEHIQNNRLPTLHRPEHDFLYPSFGLEPCSLP